MYQQKLGQSTAGAFFLMVGLVILAGSVCGAAESNGATPLSSDAATVLRAITGECHTTFTIPAAKAFDQCQGDLSGRIIVNNPVDKNKPGVYVITYNVSDDNGNTTEGIREVTVVDSRAPVIQIIGRVSVSVLRGHAYTDAGATAMDQCAGDLSAAIVTANSVNTTVLGSYRVTYDVNDGNGNSAVQAVRTVNVVSVDTTAPDITGTVSDKFLAADAACSAVVPDLTGEVVASDDVTAKADLVIAQEPPAGTLIKGLGAHKVSLSVKDEAGNEATSSATLNLTAFDHGNAAAAVVNWATNGLVSAMVADGDALYIAGDFTWAGAEGASGEGWTNLARIDAVTGEVADWKPVVGGAVHALALSADGSTLYAAGDGFVDSVNVSTASAVQLTVTTGTVAALAEADGVLYLGGEFTQESNPSFYLAAYDVVAKDYLGWTASVSGPVLSLAVSDTTLYVGEASGIETVNLAAGGKGEVGLFSLSNGPVNALAVSCETVYAGGAFTSIGGDAVSGLVALSVSGAAKSSWAPTADNGVHALALTATGLYAAGAFTSIDAVALPGLAQFKETSTPETRASVVIGALSHGEAPEVLKDAVTVGGRGAGAPLGAHVDGDVAYG